MAFIFGKETFESGTSPFTFDIYDTSGTGAQTLDTTSKVVGVNSIKLTRSTAGGARLKKTFGSDYTELYAQFKIFIPTAFTWGTGTYTGLIDLFSASEASEIGYINLEDYGTLRLTIGGVSGYINTGLDVSKNAVHKIEFRVKVSATVGRVEIWLDNNTATPSYSSGDINMGTTGMRVMWSPEVYSDGSHGDYYFDDVIVSTTFIGDGNNASFLNLMV